MHDGASRRRVGSCTPQGRDVTSFVADASAQVAAKVKFPNGVFAVFGGTAEATKIAQHQLLMNSAIAGAGILLLLIVVTPQRRHLPLLPVSLPLALVSALLAAALSPTTRDTVAILSCTPYL